MINALANRVILFLEANKTELLVDWKKEVLLSPDDPYRKVLLENGTAMIDLLISFLADDIDEEKVKYLAHKVAEERLNANINIGEFVYNVCIGRSQIFSCLPQMGLSIEELTPIMDKINVCFDKFLHFAVQHYTDLKDKRLEEQSSFIEQTHKDRLTILGQMSSSFVHEFRNPLTSIIGFVRLLKEKYPNLEYMDIMTKELDQLKFRISQFLLLSKKEVVDQEKSKFHIETICKETIDFLYPMIVSYDVMIETDIDPTLFILGYRDEFSQVLINIFLNSLDALAATPNKIVCIRAYRENDQAIISISNNGPVISPDLINTIFEPFFSTKKLGTGIGLYLCRKIIEKHGGTIHCDSSESWTTFKITISPCL